MKVINEINMKTRWFTYGDFIIMITDDGINFDAWATASSYETIIHLFAVHKSMFKNSSDIIVMVRNYVDEISDFIYQDLSGFNC